MIVAKATHKTPTVARRYRIPQKKDFVKFRRGRPYVARRAIELAGISQEVVKGYPSPVRSKGTFFAGCDFYALFTSRAGFKSEGEIPELRRFSQTAWLRADTRPLWFCCPVLAQYWC